MFASQAGTAMKTSKQDEISRIFCLLAPSKGSIFLSEISACPHTQISHFERIQLMRSYLLLYAGRQAPAGCDLVFFRMGAKTGTMFLSPDGFPLFLPQYRDSPTSCFDFLLL